MKFTIYRRQLALTFTIMIAFVLLGSLASFLVAETERHSEKNLERNHLRPSPARFAARLFSELTQNKGLAPAEALALINRARPGEPAFQIITDLSAMPAWLGSESLPTEINAPKWIKPSLFGPPAGEIVLLSQAPPTYLVFNLDAAHGPGGPPSHPPGPMPMFWLNLGVLILSMMMAVAVSLFYLFHSMRSKAELAENVLAQIRSGNLKARFPVKRLDEVGQLMQKFNTMADEIEHLVDRLKDTELRRTRLLQELAHDLRTPVASLKTFVETLHMRRETLTEVDRGQLISFSQKEIEYLEHLVEDLLFLAQVTEPKYLSAMKTVNLTLLADEELDRLNARPRAVPIHITRHYEQDEILLEGDAHLIRRLLRNALENAYSFARSEVRLQLRTSGGVTEIIVEDNGPGLSEEAIKAYGEKRATRVVTQVEGRLSVGLGSVIMRAVAQVHNGTIAIQNIKDEAQNISGAMVCVRLKRTLPQTL